MAMVNGRFYSTGSVMQKRSPKPMFKAEPQSEQCLAAGAKIKTRPKDTKTIPTFKSTPLKGNEKKNDMEWILDQRVSSNL